MKSKYPQDFIQDIRDMIAEELSARNIAWYLGAPLWLVNYIKHPDPIRRKNSNWYDINRENRLIQMREYSKKRAEKKDARLRDLHLK